MHATCKRLLRSTLGRIVASLETDFPGVAHRDSPVVGRLPPRLNYVIDKERALRLADDIGDVDAAERSGMPSGPSSLHAIGSHQDERITNKISWPLSENHLDFH